MQPGRGKNKVGWPDTHLAQGGRREATRSAGTGPQAQEAGGSAQHALPGALPGAPNHRLQDSTPEDTGGRAGGLGGGTGSSDRAQNTHTVLEKH